MARRVFGWTPSSDGEYQLRKTVLRQRRESPDGMCPMDRFLAGMLADIAAGEERGSCDGRTQPCACGYYDAPPH